MRLEPVKFLIVDDIAENIVALEALLRRDGLEILTARSGPEALELLLVHDVALALLDVQMPGMDGFELAELMRGTERTKHIPIIFVTAGARDPKRVFRGYETGAVDFLFKPVEPHVLKSKAEVFFELHRKSNELASMLRLNEMFVGILGHDLRNPLGAILTGVQLLDEVTTNDTEKRTLKRIYSAGQRMTDMIEQLLDLTRGRLAGGLGFARTRKRLDIVPLVQRTIEELRGAHPEREIQIEHQGECTTSGDPDRLLQLFSNLIANALGHGTPKTPVIVRIDGGGADIVVKIRNRGVIPPEVLPTIFDPFRTRHGSRSRGLGLGLFISHQIAVAHGGEIAVTSEHEETCFAVRIPRRMHQKPEAALVRTRTVLIVDDDDNIRESLKEAFEEEGYVVGVAANGREAMEQLVDLASRPDVVILDLVLPVMDGNRVYQSMQADPALAAIPVVVSTSNPARAPAGVVVIPKPLKLDRLLDTVARLVSANTVS